MEPPRPKVLVSTGIFPNRNDGTRGVYVFKQVRALAGKCQVEVIAPVPYFPAVIPSQDYARFTEIPDQDEIDDLPVTYPRYFVTPKILRSFHGFFLYLSVIKCYRRAAKRFRPDLILSYFAYPYGFASVLLARSLGLPVIVSCRGSDINWLARPRIRRRLISWSLRQCACVLSVSEALKREIVAMGVPEERIVVVPNGIDVERFQQQSRDSARASLGLDADKKLLVCVSRLRFEKGIDILLDAFARLDAKDVQLAIVGDGAAGDGLREQCRKLGIQDRVILPGRRPHDEVPAWISASHVVVLSSRSEGHPNVLVEALACGRPVVAANVGGVGEIVTSTRLGVVVPPEDPDALADGLRKALRTEWDAATLTAAGQARTWDTVAGDLLSLIETAADSKRPEPVTV